MTITILLLLLLLLLILLLSLLLLLFYPSTPGDCLEKLKAKLQIEKT